MGSGAIQAQLEHLLEPLRTVWGYAIEYELLTHSQINPFKKTGVTPKRPSKQ